jgi:hypothetical protein
MKKNILLITFLLYSPVCIFGQSGYMGKKFSVNFSGDFLPAIRPERLFSMSGYTLSGIKSTGGFYASYVISEKKSIELGINHFKDWESKYDHDLDEITGTHFIKQNSIVFCIKNYYRNSIPPIGGYFKVSISFTDNQFSETIDFDVPIKKYGVKIGAGFGKQRVLFDQIVLDYGISANLNLIDVLNFDNYPEETPIMRIFIRDQLYIHFGIGYLLF